MGPRVIRAFRHANTGRIWRVGDEFDGTPAQAAELASKGYLDAAGRPPEAPAEPGYDGMTVRQLVELCVRRGVETPRKPRKADLVAALKAAG